MRRCEIGKEFSYRRLEIGGGQVLGERPLPAGPLRLLTPPTMKGYVDAMIDDYGLPEIGGRRDYPWRPGVSLRLRARFSHGIGQLLGTAGFGFWNAPVGDPTVRRPALPQAVWFFFGSPPNDLPLAEEGPGQGWYAATIDAASWRAKALMPLAPLVVLGNHFARLKRWWWPWIRRQLGTAFAPLAVDMTAWQNYRLVWRADGCAFYVNGRCLLETAAGPRGPLGFVCWLDNQYMRLEVDGRFGWGTLPLSVAQWLEIADLHIEKEGAAA